MKKPLTVFSLLDTPAFGGAEQYMFSHLNHLNQEGYEVTLATNNQKVEKEIRSRLKPGQEKTFRIIKLPYLLDAIGNWKGLVKYFGGLPKAYLWCANTLRQLTHEYSTVVCLWPGFSDRLSFSRLAKQFHCPLIWIEIGPLEPTFKKTFGYPRLLYHTAENQPDHIITTSLFTKKSIVGNSRFSDTDITLIYPSTELFSYKQIAKYKRKAEVWKKKNGLIGTQLICLVARLATENEVDMVINAFSLYSKHNGKLTSKLLIIGDGPIRKDLEALTHKLGLADRIIFTGFVTEEDKRMFFAGCTFFVFPRAWELDGFGMTTIEAMSLGLPVLTTDFGPQVEIITDGIEGFKYKPHDSEDLAKKIEKMMTLDTKKHSRMSQNAINRVQDFAEASAHKKMLSVIRSVTQ